MIELFNEYWCLLPGATMLICIFLFWIYDKIKIILRKRKEIKNEIKEEKNLRCPTCRNDTWYEGPGGGSFGNIQCGKCKTWYNHLGPFGLRKIENK